MTVILCFGNEWHGDDGFGYAVYQELTETKLPNDTELHYCATNSLLATSLLKKASNLILVDAYQANNHKAGKLEWFSKDEFQSNYARNLHDGGLDELIRHCDILFCSQAVTINILTITIDKVTGFSGELSPPIKEKIPEASSQILARLNQEPVHASS